MWECDDCHSEAFPDDLELYRGQWLCGDCYPRIAEVKA